MRTLAIGDIHGCLQALCTLLDAVGLNPDDRVITLGDYVDRGPDSKGVLDRLTELYAAGQLVALRGNHDQMMIDVFHGGDPALWLSCGGPATLRSYGIPVSVEPELDQVPPSHWDFL